MRPGAPWKIRDHASAGSTRLRLSGFHSRAHLIRKYTYPSSAVERALAQLAGLYVQKGHDLHSCRQALRKVRAPSYFSLGGVSYTLSSTESADHGHLCVSTPVSKDFSISILRLFRPFYFWTVFNNSLLTAAGGSWTHGWHVLISGTQHLHCVSRIMVRYNTGSDKQTKHLYPEIRARIRDTRRINPSDVDRVSLGLRTRMLAVPILPLEASGRQEEGRYKPYISCVFLGGCQPPIT